MRRSTVLPALLLILGLSVLLGAGRAHAQEVDEGARAAEVLAAVESSDTEKLAELAAADDPDPWLVAEELCFRGEFDAAAAFAEAAPRADVAALPAYVAARREDRGHAAARTALTQALAALERGEQETALRLLGAADTSGGDLVAARLRLLRGDLLRSARRLDDAVRDHLTGAEIAGGIGWLAGQSRGLNGAGYDHYLARRYEKTLEVWEQWQAVLESRERPELLAGPLTNRALVLRRLGRADEALVLQRRALEVAEEVGDQRSMAANLVNIGAELLRRGEVDEAQDHLERGLRLAEEIGQTGFAANALIGLASIAADRGEYARAVEYGERGLELRRELGDPRGVADALVSLALVRQDVGSGPEAHELYEEVLAISRSTGDHPRVALALANMGVIHSERGEYAEALDLLERALVLEEQLESDEGRARVLTNLSRVYYMIAAPDRAMAALERALPFWEAAGDELRAAEARAGLNALQGLHGDPAEVLAGQQRVLEQMRELGNELGMATALVNIASAQKQLGDLDAAEAALKSALAKYESSGRQSDVVRTLVRIGTVCHQRGESARAIEYADRARALAVEAGNPFAEVFALGLRVFARSAQERHAEAAAAAGDLVRLLPLVVGRLGDVEGASARDGFSNVISSGVHAAARAGDADQALFLMESGRAAALLESLGGQERLQSALLPEDLRVAQSTARRAVEDAQLRLGEALAERRLKPVARAREALDEAHAELRAVIGRIQRTQKSAAGITHPEPTGLAELQSSLRPGEAFVGYDTRTDATVALVVTKDEARVHLLDPIVLPERPSSASADWDGTAERLREGLIAPLGLGADTTRILVSPPSALVTVPFAAVCPDREVVHVPSASTLVQLMSREEPRGRQVLALGDPDYDARPGTHSGGLYFERLPRLPGTRAEAVAVGDVTLLGAEATETRLAAALAEHEGRWRAVHLACHGIVKPDQPLLSSLALSPDERTDGALTVMEVLRSTIDADLVVLSACETGLGELSASEGMLGFTRAYMLAGTPRVIVSLWKVDDAATSALMRHFYEQWKDGQTSTAAALHAAQRHVASQEKWSHPYYWAAWQLWGRGD